MMSEEERRAADGGRGARGVGVRVSRGAAVSIVTLSLAVWCSGCDGGGSSSSAAPGEEGTTSADLVAALAQLEPFVVEHGLTTRSGRERRRDVPASESAAADDAGEAILLSSGRAADGGLGDTDFLDDGNPDETTFTMTLRVPESARTLTFVTRFTSAEVTGPGTARRDDASGVRRASLSGAGARFTVLGSGATSYARENVPTRHALDVEGETLVRVSFVVEDRGDGATDSALRISDAYFSEQPDPGPLPPADQLQFGERIPERTLHAGAVNLATGSVGSARTLLAASSGSPLLALRLFYNAAERSAGALGPGWSHSFADRLEQLADGSELRVKRADGSADYFVPRGVGGDEFSPRYAGVRAALRRAAGGAFVYVSEERVEYEFSSLGRLRAVRGPNLPALRVEQGERGPTEVVDDLGHRLAFNYDVAGHLARVERAGGGVARFTYDAGDRLASFEAPGTAAELEYDPEGRLVRVRDGEGYTVANVAWAGDRARSFVDAGGTLAEVTYEGDARTVLAGGDRSATRTFDAFGFLVASTDAPGAERTYTYDANHRLIARTGPATQSGSCPASAENSSRFERDEDGDPLRYVDALGNAIVLSYDAAGNVASHEDQAGHVTTYEWNGAAGTLAAKTDPLGNTVRYTYTDDGDVATVTDRRGNTTRLTYTAARELAGIEDALGSSTVLERDEIGRVVALEDALGRRTTLAYEGASDRVVRATDALGGVALRQFDAEGRLLRTTDARETAGDVEPGGGTTIYAYDDNGRVRSVRDPTGAVTAIEYGPDGEIVSTQYPLGLRTGYAYDANGRLAEVADGGDAETIAVAAAEYDAAGNRTAQTDPNGNRYELCRDVLGRLVVERDPCGNEVLNEYDPRGILVRETNARGQPIEYEHDPAGNLVATRFGTTTITAVVDEEGQVVEAVETDATGDARVVTNARDALGRLVQRTDPFGRSVQYEYDAAGNLSALTYPDGARVVYEYDALDRLTSVVDQAGRRTEYDYDPAGNPIEARLADGATVRYAYDGANRLTMIDDVAADGRTVFRADYTYDAAGRPTTVSTVSPLEAPFSSGATSAIHGEDNRLLSAGAFDAFAYDADGNMISGTVDGATPVELEYDVLNRLVRLGEDTYEYDSDGRRIAAEIAGQRREYVQDAAPALSRLLAEYDGSGRLVARYVYGLGLVTREDGEGQLRVYHFDDRGSTVALTDESGATTDRLAYGPFGRLLARQGTTETPFAWSGRDGVVDDGNGLYFLRTRYYAPALMRLVSRAALQNGTLADTQSLNRYAFFAGEPVRRIDPRGPLRPSNADFCAHGPEHAGALPGTRSLGIAPLDDHRLELDARSNVHGTRSQRDLRARQLVVRALEDAVGGLFLETPVEEVANERRGYLFGAHVEPADLIPKEDE